MNARNTSHVTTGDGVRIAYRFDGNAELPVLLLSNSIGTDLHMWDDQIAALTAHFRVLRYDARGHGKSGVPEGAYSLDRLGRDVVELLDALALQRVHVLGLSLGGFVGQWLGIHAPERVNKLVLSNTAAYLGPAATWDQAIATVMQAPDMAATAQMFIQNWFPREYRVRNEKRVRLFHDTLLASKRQGIAGNWAAVRDADLRRTIALISTPSLVIAGIHDTVTTLDHGKQIAATIPNAQFVALDTVHMSNIEKPDEFVAAVVDFLAGGHCGVTM